MNLKQLIQRLQEIDAKCDKDLDMFTVSEIGLVQISDIRYRVNTYIRRRW